MRFRLDRLLVLATIVCITLVVVALLAIVLLVVLWPEGAALFGGEPVMD